MKKLEYLRMKTTKAIGFCRISQLARLSSKLLRVSERKEKRVEWSQLLVIAVSENAFALSSQLLRLA